MSIPLQIMSDLHLELMRGPRYTPTKTAADVVILAGDIHNGTRAIDWARAQFPAQEVIYVAGNHEYYGQVWAATLPALRQRAAALGVHFLDQDCVELFGVRFLGATLWTDFDLYGPALRDRCMREAAIFMNDYATTDVRRLRAGDEVPGMGRRVTLTPKQTRKWCLSARAWLAEQLDLPFAGPTVVVTHHLPHLRSVLARFTGDLVNAAFASDLGDMFGVPKLWVHGHTHDATDYEWGCGTRVVCNPRGHQRLDGRRESRVFRDDLTIDLTIDIE